MMDSPQQWAELQRLFHLAEPLSGGDRERALAEACSDPALCERVLTLLRAGERSPGDAPTARMRIGPYPILKLLGSGGVGSVYLAERELAGAKQLVALKVLAPHAAGRGFADRFEREQRVLAALDHPNVTRLIDAGLSENGQPYLVTEYVEGKHLDAYCEEHQLAAGERLVLMEQVCAAVDHAHRNLIIHLDLKPSNILVTGAGKVKLLDFGTAKLVQPDGIFTATIVATPAYASPEQLRNEPLTTASDVYSLGVILHELILGERPSRPRPATPKTVPADLSTMLLKCLAESPGERYASVSALATDIARYREGRPLLAHPQTTLYQVTKFLRRNRGKVAAALVLALALTGTLGYAWWQQNRALRSAQRAIRMQAFLYRLFKNANPNVAGAPEPTVKQFLEKSAEVLPWYLKDPDDLRQAQLSLALSLYWNQDYAPAKQLYHAALESARRAHDGAGEAEALGNLANIAFFEGRNAEAKQEIDQSFRLASHSDVPADLRFLLTEKYVLINGDLSGKKAQELKNVLEAAVKEARLKSVNPDDIAESLNYLGGLELNASNVDAAAKDYQDALNLYRQDPLSDCDQSLTELGLAAVRREQELPDQAVELLRKSYATDLKCWGSTPYTQNHEARVADALVAAGKVSDGLAMLEKARPGWSKPPVNRSVVFANLKYLAHAYVEAGRFADAERASADAYDLFGREMPADSTRLAAMHLEWARALAGEGRWAEALPHATIAERALGEHPVTPLQKSTARIAQALLSTVRANVHRQ